MTSWAPKHSVLWRSQSWVQIPKACGALEHHVRGELGLRGAPVVLAAVQHVAQLRHDSIGVAVQNLRPVKFAESIGQALRLGKVLDPGEHVIDLGTANLARRQFV